MVEKLSTIYTYLPYQSSNSIKSLTNISKVLSDLGKPTRRGIKKCPKCGIYNGARSLICKNKYCHAILKDNSDKRQFNLDAIKLNDNIRQVYSVRVHDRGLSDCRGFVQLPYLNDKVKQNALCFVDSCQRLFDDSILKCHEDEITSLTKSCIHIDSALKSQNLATPLIFKEDILKKLKISTDLKRKLWLLATENDKPLVQRITKTVMAVKCKVSPKHPFGYLHFIFGSSKGKDILDKFYCSCIEYFGNKFNNCIKCIHYYACIWALIESKFASDFLYFINNELPKNSSIPKESTKNILKMKPKVTKLNYIKKNKMSKQCYNLLKKKKENNIIPNIFPIQIKIIQNDEISWKFLDWLSHVTESINRTIHFDNCGIINMLIFYTPKIFFEELRKIIPSIYMENNYSNQNIYNIMNILHLKQIFDTQLVKLKISKRFIHDNKQGFIEFNENDNEENCQVNYIYFLNVGVSTVDESNSTNNSFIIEWIDDNISTITNVGQLKLQYKYGRKSL